MKEHPAKQWHSRLFWKDNSDQPNDSQIIDLLHDARFLLLLIFLAILFGR